MLETTMRRQSTQLGVKGVLMLLFSTTDFIKESLILLTRHYQLSIHDKISREVANWKAIRNNCMRKYCETNQGHISINLTYVMELFNSKLSTLKFKESFTEYTEKHHKISGNTITRIKLLSVY